MIITLFIDYIGNYLHGTAIANDKGQDNLYRY